MKNITETHPSLKFKEKVISFNIEEHDDYRWNENYNYLSKEVYDKIDVQKHTIDKAVLKEAINKHIVYCCDCGCTFGKDKLLKELGLDEE